tara:strand:+ start:1657 stop:2082 length:426 start_codon:yes stop_codon:yes gene_type:complete
MSLSREEIDKLAKKLDHVNEMMKTYKSDKQILEREIEIEFEQRSENTWASELVGNEMVIKRGSTKIIKPDELRAAIGEWVEPEELDRCIVPEHTEIKTVPEKVSVTEVNKIHRQGGRTADYIDKVTKKITSSIKVSKKEEL